MRLSLVFLVPFLIAVPVTAQSMDVGYPVAATQDAGAGNARLDALFMDLKRERNEQAAHLIASRIGDAWAQSGSANADLMMKWASDAIKAKNYAMALDFLDQVVTLFPDYVEGWNRRATLHFMMDDYARSMADIAETLNREPRHFGALAGMAGILEATGRDDDALEAYRRVLEIYPMMRSAQSALTKLSDALTGEGI